jgi:hypothetical protein
VGKQSDAFAAEDEIITKKKKTFSWRLKAKGNRWAAYV